MPADGFLETFRVEVGQHIAGRSAEKNKRVRTMRSRPYVWRFEDRTSVFWQVRWEGGKEDVGGSREFEVVPDGMIQWQRQ